MNEVFLKAISIYVPDRVLDNIQLEREFPEWSVEKISEKTGIDRRFIAADDETSGDMAFHACEKLFSEHNLNRTEVDYLILCTQSPDYFLPTTACILQERLKLRTSIGAIDINLGCSGFVYGIGLAKALIASKQASSVLVVTSETYSKFIHPNDKSNRTIFGDAAAATLVSAVDGFARIGEFEYGTDGRGADNLIVRNGGMRQKAVTGQEVMDEYGNIRSEDHLFMDGSEIFLFTLSAVPKLIELTLTKNGLTSDNIRYFVLHQANKFMLEKLRKRIDVSPERFPIRMGAYGNTVSSTLPIVISELLDESQPKSGDEWLLAGFGVGYSWAGTVITIV